MEFNTLTPEEERVIVHKGTELPFTGKFNSLFEEGTYVCRRCNAPLYRSADKFEASCGWPAFDDEIAGAVKRTRDADGHRIEIECATCGAHLGHVFVGERLTKKNTRHCVNSLSMSFIPAAKATAVSKAIFAGGCFWGMEYQFKKAKGVTAVYSGYTGGTKANPTYKEVCAGKTGHLEAIEVSFDPSKTTYEELAKLFFEIHDPTQKNGQGPDIGEQYHSAVFYVDDEQKRIAEKLIGILQQKGLSVATQLIKAGTFWKAEDYHQDYYAKTGGAPYCHAYTKRF
jgi:peptide methionine sulfoxide reductase msrA/msrB